MRYKTQCECMDKECNTVILGPENRLDGISCPRCGGPVIPNPFEKYQREPQLLVIELDTESSVPRVFYEGKEITAKVRINFNWETKQSFEDSGRMNFNIESYEKDSTGYPIQKRIGINKNNKKE